ncbi:MAG: MFS transporter [Rhodocyclaceae bacterium]
MAGRRAQALAIGTAQIIAWGSSTYLPASIAAPMAAGLGLETSAIFAAYSGALGLMAVLGPAIGRLIDGHRGRAVLCASNLILAAGLVLLAVAPTAWAMVAGWTVIGVGMACGLYDAAFATLVREQGTAARPSITGVTLLGGFASTLAWPVTAWLVSAWNWPTACLAWAAAHLCLALPLNYFAIQPAAAKTPPSGGEAHRPAARGAHPAKRRNFLLLAVFGAATAFVASAMSAHLPLLLGALGLAPAAAIAAAALFGPAQVMARLAEFLAATRLRTGALATARWATFLFPAGAGTLLAVGGSPLAASLFVLLHGAGNGLITIAKGVLPLALFGPQGYGVLQGRLAVVQRGMQAIAPLSFALVLERGGAATALAMTLAVASLAWVALMLIRRPGEENG